MPLPRRFNGRPGTQVVPAGWGASHAGVLANAVATASLVRIGAAGGASAWDEGLGRMVTQPAAPVYVGAADIMAVSDVGRVALVAEDVVPSLLYDVTLPYTATAGVAVDMVITVDPSDPDPMLAGRTLQVGYIERGSRRFSRVLLAILLD